MSEYIYIYSLLSIVESEGTKLQTSELYTIKSKKWEIVKF